MPTVSIYFVLFRLPLCKGDFSLKPPSVTKKFRGNTAHIHPGGLHSKLAFHSVFAPTQFLDFMVGGSRCFCS